MRKRHEKQLDVLHLEDLTTDRSAMRAKEDAGADASAAAAAGRLLPQSGTRGDLPSTTFSGQFPPNFMQYLALARGMEDGFEGMGIDGMQAPTFDYPLPAIPQIRSFCSAIPIPFTAFDGIRSTRHKVELTPAQEANVVRSLAKILSPQAAADAAATVSGGGSGLQASLPPRSSAAQFAEDISVSLPFVSAFFDQRCPELRNGVLTKPRTGATYLLLAVITGHLTLCQRCLEYGANPNSMSFLQEGNPPFGEMFHGYSPMFMAVLAEQLPVMDKLREYGGSVHVYDRWGRTPLHAAVAMNSAEVVQWLLAKGAPRFVGDCLNLIPAESADDDYFPGLAMPNAAMHGAPPEPPLEVLKRLHRRPQASGTSAMDTTSNTKSSGGATGEGCPEAEPSRSTEGDDSTSGATSSSGGDAGVPPGVELCHCLSGRPAGYCGCVDDMYARWAVDRLRTTWGGGVNFAELAKKQSAEKQQRFVATRRRKQ